LPHGDEDQVFQEFLTRYQRDPHYRRRYGKDYMARRLETESILRELFISRGGKPKRKNPYYFVLGQSPWFSKLNSEHQEIRICLADLDPSTTSLTYPDSFVAMTRRDKPYYRKVFFLSETASIIQEYGIPQNDHLVPYDRYWETDFELYIEVQVWDNPPV
jgi:hypothetical protein